LVSLSGEKMQEKKKIKTIYYRSIGTKKVSRDKYGGF